MATDSSIFRKAWTGALVILGIAFVLWLCWISLPALIPFLVGILLAYLLFPFVTWLEGVLPPRGRRSNARRAAAVIIVFVLFTLLLIAFTVYVGAAIINASNALIAEAPELSTKGMALIADWTTSVKTIIPADSLDSIRQSIMNAGPAISKFLQDFLVGSIMFIPSNMSTITGFIMLPFFLIFVLLNYEQYGKYFNEIFPANMARHTTKVLSIFGTQMGLYIRFMIIMAAIEGALVTLGLLIAGVQYSPALGALAAFLQVIPIIGCFISAAVILLMTLALNPQAILPVLIVLAAAQLVVQALQGWVQGKHFPMDPGVVMVLMMVGGFIGSYIGIILALPAGATAWKLYQYFRGELKAPEPEKGQT